MFSRILCPVDFSDATDIGLRPAVALAEALGSKLFLLFVIEFPHESVAHERIYLEIEDNASLRLAELAGRFPVAGGTSTVVLRGTPYEQIAQFAAEQNVDLVVMPTHQHAGLDRLFAGRVSERVARLAHCPVLLVPPETGMQESFRPRVVLVGTDFSAYADAALPGAEAVAAAFGAELLIAHVLALAERGTAAEGWRYPVLPEAVEQQALAEAQSQLDARALESRTRSGLEVSARLVRGTNPAQELGELSSEVGAGLIVVASHGHAAVARMLLGSTCEQLVRAGNTAVMIVRPPEV